MSSRRGLPPIPHTDAPWGTCRWCGKGIQKGDGSQNLRRRWHQACLDEFLDHDPQRLRRKVYDRDRGVCVACGVDTDALGTQMRAELHQTGGAGWSRQERNTPTGKQLQEEGYRLNQSLWDCDHVTPLEDGGAQEMANLQTLCQPCHRVKTARENSERARRRRGD